MENSVKARTLLHSARSRVLSTHPAYGYIACSLKLREQPDIPTMATDGVSILYNPDFVCECSKTQLVAGIVHETMHAYLEHPIRGLNCAKGDMKYWPHIMFAGDMAINPRLKDGGFDMTINGGELVFPEQEHWHESLEEHFKRLKKGKSKGPNGCSGFMPSPAKDAAERAKLQRDMQKTIMAAAEYARNAGNLPADIARLVESLRAPRVSWKDVTRRFMQSTAKSDYRMMPPNRRFIHQGIYVPSLRSETVGRILLLIDGSGSTYRVFPQFISEFASILLDVRPEILDVLVWDTQCSWMQQFDTYSDESANSIAALQSKMGAGGGTDFTNCFDYYAEKVGAAPQVAIVLTDMEMYGWPENPGYPVLWVATNDIQGPFGETTRIEVEE